MNMRYSWPTIFAAQTMKGREVAEWRDKEGDVESVEHSVGRSLEAERAPQSAEQAPTNLALIYVMDYVPEVEDDVLREVENHDVVLLARGGELASHMATRFMGYTRSLRVVNFADPRALARYVGWLRELAEKYPRAEVRFVTMDLHPVCGEPSAWAGTMELQGVWELGQIAV
jgi:hypothetical protein